MTSSRAVGPVGIVILLLLLALLLVPPTTWPAGIPNAIWAPDPKEDVGPLYGIAGVDPDDVWAVGRTVSAPQKALIAHWDGRQWSVAERLSVIPRNHVLKDVVALATDDVWAVGSYESGREWTGDAVVPPARTPLIVHWDGTSWEVVPIKIGGEGEGELEAIATTKDGLLWAVGNVLLRWDGSSWEEMAMPHRTDGYPDWYLGIAAVADDDVWVVGSEAIYHWDGAAWNQTFDAPHTQSGVHPDFEAVEVIADNDVWVAGQDQWSGGLDHTRFFLLHWNGTAWEDAGGLSMPSSMGASRILSEGCTGFGYCSLMNFAARSSSDIWLVGELRWYPLVVHWDGAQWESDPCPAGDPEYLSRPMGSGIRSGDPGPLYDVAIFSPAQVWAVGSRTFTEDQRRIEYGYVHSVLHGPCPPPKPTATYPPTPTPDTRPRPTLPPPPQTVYPTIPTGPGTMYPLIATPDAPPGIPTAP